MEDKPRILVWFSCGMTSAVAAKMTVDKYPDRDVQVIYCETNSEHPDSERFLQECAKWIGMPILRIKSEKYTDIWDVFEKTRWLVGPAGARCTTELKKNPRRDYQRPDDIHVFGFDTSEVGRADRWRENNFPSVLWTPLIEEGVSKKKCAKMLRDAGIDAAKMYQLGYKNNNCIGCCKGGAGYWNKIRVDFPEVFDRMSKVERNLNAAMLHRMEGGERVRVFLDELHPKVGNYHSEPDIACGLTCGGQEPMQEELDWENVG